MAQTPIQRLKSRVEKAAQERMTREGHWDVIQAFVVPSKLTYHEMSGTIGQSNADSRERKLMDSTAPISSELFASFLMSHVFINGATAPSALDFIPKTPDGQEDDTKAKSHTFQKWAKKARAQILGALFSGRRNAIGPLHEVALDLGTYGTSCFAIWADPKITGGPVLFQHFSPRCASGTRDAGGDTDTINLQMKMSRRAAVKRFPGKGIEMEGKEEEDIEIYFSAMRADDPELEVLVSSNVRAQDTPWYGVWFYPAESLKLEETGYSEQPIFLPAWYYVDGSVWGRSPSMTALASIAKANVMAETSSRSAEKLADPPYQARDGMLLSPLRNYPGGITYTDTNDPLIPLIPPGASRVEFGRDIHKDTMDAIERAFFIPLFHDTNPTGSVQPRTLGEVEQHKDERNRAVTPMVLRLQTALIEPVVTRVLGILQRSGAIPAPPIDEGSRIEVRYASPVVSSQRQLQAIATLRFVEGLALVSQLDPLAMDNLDGDEAAKVLHTASGVPIEVLTTQDKRDERRTARAEQQQQMQQAAMANEGGKTLAALRAAEG